MVIGDMEPVTEHRPQIVEIAAERGDAFFPVADQRSARPFIVNQVQGREQTGASTENK